MTTDRIEECSPDPTGALSSAAPFVETAEHNLSVHPLSAELIADGVAMRKLRSSLDATANSYCDGMAADANMPLDRSIVIEVLNGMYLGLRERLVRTANLEQPTEGELEIIFDHPTMSLLNDFIGVLKDLDNAKPHTVFETPKVSRAASLSTAEVARRDALLELVDLVKFKEGFSSRAKAEEWLAQRMKKAIGRDKAPKASQLADMRKTRRKKQKRAS